jgi:hypothetical protein
MPPFPQIEGVRFAHIPDWPNYAASDDGRIWSCRSYDRYLKTYREWHVLKPHKRTNGYLCVALTRDGENGRRVRRTKNVHPLVLSSFTPKPDGGLFYCVHYPDPTKSNNALSNLRWGTPQENRHHEYEHGTHPCGEQYSNSKLTSSKVLEIYRLRKEGMQYQELADHFGVSNGLISHILKGRAWPQLYHHYKETGA